MTSDCHRRHITHIRESVYGVIIPSDIANPEMQYKRHFCKKAFYKYAYQIGNTMKLAYCCYENVGHIYMYNCAKCSACCLSYN